MFDLFDLDLIFFGWFFIVGKELYYMVKVVEFGSLVGD